MSTVAAQLRSRREAAGLTLEDAAWRAGISAETLQAWESGEVVPDGRQRNPVFRVLRGAARRTKAPEQAEQGARIREAREAAGLTQHQLAELLGTTNVTVSRWETGRGAPAAAMRERLAEVLDPAQRAAAVDRRLALMREVIGSELRSSERLLMLVIAERVDPGTGLVPEDAEPTSRELAEGSNLSQQRTVRYLTALVGEGWLTRRQRDHGWVTYGVTEPS